MNRFFITGTGTDSGKTYVTRELIRYFPGSIALKPVASGCLRENEQLVSSDAHILTAENDLSPQQINPWRFELPVSPHIAAAQENSVINSSDLFDYCMSFQLPNVDRYFIEGAGGLMVPFNDQQTWLDFLIFSKMPVILVVGMKLGCINHALLTLSVLKTYDISCVGWIANCLDTQMLFCEENISTITQLSQIPLLAKVPYSKTIEIIKSF